MRPTFEETVILRRAAREKILPSDSLSVSKAYTLALASLGEPEVWGRQAGTRVTIQNTVEQIPNSVVGSQGIGESDGD